MFTLPAPEGYVSPAPGVERKTLAYGERTLMTEFRMRGGSSLPRHHHPHEQTGYLVSGRIRLTIGSETLELGPGTSWCIPSDVEHEAEVFEDSVALEVFSPVRPDYLP